MERHTSEILREQEKELDRGMVDVMPSEWVGHARYKIERTSDLSRKQKDFAKTLAERIIEKNGDKYEAEAVADKAIEKAREKLGE